MSKSFARGGCPSTTKELFTGSGNCDVKKGYVKSLILGKVSSALELADGDVDVQDIANLQGNLYTREPNINKMWIIDGIVTNGAPEGGDNITSSNGERGGSRIVGQNPVSVTYSVSHSICKLSNLLQFKGMKVRVIEVDDNDTLFGIANKTTETLGSTLQLKGYLASLWVTVTPATASADALINIHIAHDVDYFTKEEPNMSGIKYPVLPEAKAPASVVRVGKGTAKVMINCSGEDIGQMYVGLIDNAAFEEKDGLDFTVTYDVATSVFTFMTTDAIPVAHEGSFRLVDGGALEAKLITGVTGVDEFVSLA